MSGRTVLVLSLVSLSLSGVTHAKADKAALPASKPGHTAARVAAVREPPAFMSDEGPAPAPAAQESALTRIENHAIVGAIVGGIIGALIGGLMMVFKSVRKVRPH